MVERRYDLHALRMLLFVFLFLAAVPAAAQGPEAGDPDQETPEYEIEDTEVVAPSLGGSDHLNLTVPTQVVTEMDIRQEMPLGLGEMLDTMPGFDVSTYYHTEIRLRGLVGKNILFLKDGNRYVSSQKKGVTGHMINIFNVDRLDAIRGPGTVIYGPGAIAGIVNIVTSDPFATKGFKGRLTGLYGSNNTERMAAGGLRWCSGKLAFEVNGRYRDADEYHYSDGRTARNSNIQDRDITARFGWKPFPGHTWVLEYDKHWSKWGKPLYYNGVPTNLFVKYPRDDEERVRTEYTVSNLSLPDRIGLSLYFNRRDRDQTQESYNTDWSLLNEYLEKNVRTRYGGGRLFADFSLGSSHLITVGADTMISDFENPSTLYTVTTGTNPNPSVKGAGILSFGGFLQDEWALSKQIRLTGGVRYDRATMDQGEFVHTSDEPFSGKDWDAFSGNVGLVFVPWTPLRLRANVGRALRFPDILEMVALTYSGKGLTAGNPNLNPEKSWNFDLGARWEARNLTVDASGFVILLDDLISEVSTFTAGVDLPYSNKNITLTYVNIDEARLVGGELEALYRFEDIFGLGPDLVPRLTAAYVHGEDTKTDEPLSSIPPLRLRAFLRLAGQTNLLGGGDYYLEAECDFHAKQDRVAAYEKPTGDYALYGLKAGLKLWSVAPLDTLYVNVSVENLLDETYRDYLSYIPGMGRNVKVLVQSDF
jgi:hemoglobin/transferrin/lactoferrin receptor protein